MSTPLQHIAFILDGNRRWAKEHNRSPQEGHTAGFDNAKNVIDLCTKKGIPYVTMYAWSTENHKKRDSEERTHIFTLFEQFKNYLSLFQEHNIRFHVIGKYEELPLPNKKVLSWLMKETKDHTNGVTTLAINYGGRDELTRAMKKICEAKLTPEEITEDTIANYLDTAGIPNPDLLIRTGKENCRISNYLLWQLAYAEFYFPGVYWPAFDEDELDKAITYFNTVKRNFGK